MIETLNEIYVTEREYVTLKNNGVIIDEKLYGKPVKIQKSYPKKIFFEVKEKHFKDSIKNKLKIIKNRRF